MPDQRNFGFFTYESDDGTSYNIQADLVWAAIAGHGLAARVSGQPRYIATGRKQPRRVTYTDTTTGRSVTGPVGTNAAYQALAIGAVQAFTIVGQAGTVNYTLTSKHGERVPTDVVARPLLDHA
jgi:hypothetical protein